MTLDEIVRAIAQHRDHMLLVQNALQQRDVDAATEALEHAFEDLRELVDGLRHSSNEEGPTAQTSEERAAGPDTNGG
jgi:hypothetical protein